ncbi:MAG TPA: aromatic ring-hydroxylating dioxygenase subunit alpha [Caulobacteraceae bacterium]|jgi:phenylpropionate dioxygenase-like ring-hydroxylating dioxygenase large terminal subunit|nr:aromatic ring-hydroxylating dioxygenase subunit alpha [Caulobacteraceae bacterium]
MGEGDSITAELEAAPRPSAVFGQGFLHGLWYFAALSAELKPGRLKRFELLGEPVLLGRTRSGQVYALRDVCPHRASPLSAGRLKADETGAEVVECPYHGWTFRTRDGVCTKVASQVAGQDFEAERIRVRNYPACEQQGLVWIFMAESVRSPGPDGPPPLFEGVMGGAPKLVERMDFKVHIDHAVVGLMDPAHGPYVHRHWWWRSSSGRYDKQKRFEPRDLGFVMLRHEPSKNSRAYRILGGEPLTEISFRLPALRWEHITVGKRQVLALTCLTPVNDGLTRITQIFWSDHPVFSLIRPVIRLLARRFLRDDGDMVNLQNQGLAYDPPLMWVDDADRQAKWYQQLKKAWAASRASGRAFVNPVEPALLRWRS